jgi:hypothetical protein
MHMGAVSYKDMFAPPLLTSPPPNEIRRAAGLLAPLPPPVTSPFPPPTSHLGQFSAASLEIKDGL